MSHGDQPAYAGPNSAREFVARAFGAENRARLLARYFDDQPLVTPANAWQHVYRLLLWIDRTTALAHCYESDKAQPGRAWYGRSLAFHDWVSNAFDLSPADLGEHIDWLFREAAKDLAHRVLAIRTDTYQEQRAAYQGRGFPEPGDDAELVGIIKDVLGAWMNEEPPEAEFRMLTRRIYVYMTQENKRRNLVGEAFEDVIAAVIKRLPWSDSIQVRARCLLHKLPGFYPPAVRCGAPESGVRAPPAECSAFYAGRTRQPRRCVGDLRQAWTRIRKDRIFARRHRPIDEPACLA